MKDEKAAVLIFWNYLEKSIDSEVVIVLNDGRRIIIKTEDDNRPVFKIVKDED